MSNSELASLQKLTYAVGFILFSLVPAGAGAAEREIYIAQGSTAAVFPQCGAPESLACEYPLTIQVYSIDFRIEHPPVAQLDVLPTPLLSVVTFGLNSKLRACPVEALTQQLRIWEDRSREQPTVLVGTGIPARLTPCFQGALTTVDEQSMILLWRGGDVHAWIDCDGMSCFFQVHPPAEAFKQGGLQFGVRVDLISYGAVARFSENMEDVVSKLLAKASADLRELYLQLHIDAPTMDVVAADILSAGTSALIR